MTNTHQIAFAKNSTEKGIVIERNKDNTGNEVLSVRLESTGETKLFGYDEVVLMGDVHYMP